MSQNAANGTSDALDNLENISMHSDIIEAFKEISEPNTTQNPKKETGGLLLGRKFGDRYIIDTLLIPKQNGYPDYFETTDEQLMNTSVILIRKWFYLGLSIHILALMHSYPVLIYTCSTATQ